MKNRIKLYKRPGRKIINHIADIASLLTENWFTPNVPENIRMDLMFQDALCLKKQEEILSFIVFTSLDGSINISLMGTHPDFRNQGFGSVLIEYLFEYVKGLGFGQVTAFTVPPDRKPSYASTVAFYKKHGFRFKKRYNELWESGALEFVKEL